MSDLFDTPFLAKTLMYVAVASFMLKGALAAIS